MTSQPKPQSSLSAGGGGWRIPPDAVRATRLAPAIGRCDYALFGAAAQMRYTEPVATFDAAVLVAVPTPDRFPTAVAIHDACSAVPLGGAYG
ncbi:MAG: hypothetical protein KJ072_28080 [Verrucomicrobia bacterium]|nr:hypothetical protein [Verrucomicrobiota bacterium]